MTWSHSGASPKKGRKTRQTVNNVYYYPLSKKYRHPRDYVFKSSDNVKQLKDYYKKLKKYPWSDWEDGSWWQIRESEDYTCSTLNMLRYLHVHGWRKGYRVNAYRLPDNKAIRFQFYTGEPRYLSLRAHGVHWRDTRRIF